MSVSTEILIICLAVGLLTYLLRVGGYLVMSVAPPGRFLRAWMESIPGAVFVAMIAPAAMSGRIPEIVGLAITVAIAWKLRNDFAAMLLGVASVAGLRALGL